MHLGLPDVRLGLPAGGGGGEIGGGGYTLLSTAGQPDVGAALTGGDYMLIGGFWPGGGVAQPLNNIYLPLVTRTL